MKTTLPDGTTKYVYEDSDLDDEIMPGKINHIRLGTFIFCACGLVVFGIASVFYFW